MIELQKKLEQMYDELLSEFTEYSYDQIYLFTRLAEKIKVFNEASMVALYLFNNQDQFYYLQTATTDNKYSLKKSILKNEMYNEEAIFENPLMEGRANVYQFDFGDYREALLVVVAPKLNINDSFFVKETEKFLSIVTQMFNDNMSKLDHQILYNISKKLFLEMEKDKTLSEIITTLQTLYPSFSYYLLLSQDNDDISALPIKTINFNQEMDLLSTEVYTTGKLQIENKQEEDKTYLYSPLTGKQGIYGVLQIITPITMIFSEREIEFLKEFSNLAGIAIERATLYEKSNHQVNSLSLINKFTQNLNANLDVSEILKLVKKEIIQISNPSEIGFVYLDDSSSVACLSASTSFFKTSLGTRFMKQFYFNRRDHSEVFFSGKFEGDALLPYQSLITIPVNYVPLDQGLVVILHEDSYHFTFEEFKLMETLIQHATLALTNASLKEKLHKAVITDFLTGLHSRNYLEEQIINHMKTGERGVLLLFDIDDFKKVNDAYGHHVGDKVIKQIADVFLSIRNSADVPARWGGEELAIYLPNKSLKESEQIAERLCDKVAQITKPHVTLSCGISSWERGEENSVINLFIRTDKALYKAKNSGKNRIIKN